MKHRYPWRIELRPAGRWSWTAHVNRTDVKTGDPAYLSGSDVALFITRDRMLRRAHKLIDRLERTERIET